MTFSVLSAILYTTKQMRYANMTEKNRKKAEAKKFRNVWNINPITRCKGNDKADTRKTKHKNKEW